MVKDETQPRIPMTVQEMPEFAKEADRILGDALRIQLLTFLGLNPTAGAIVQGTGGIRKLRWAVPGRGKRGGARVIYYFYNQSVPLLALDMYAKNDQEDLTEGQKKRFRVIAEGFAKAHRRGR
jgi:RelE toxin of RelE / RelB toxin-antitoxin system